MKAMNDGAGDARTGTAAYVRDYVQSWHDWGR